MRPVLPRAYYNLGIIIANEGKTDQAIRLFKTAKSMDPNLTDAEVAIQKLEKKETRSTADWYAWWFGKSSLKKVLGGSIVILSVALVAKAIYDIFLNVEVPTSLFGILGVLMIFLMLPFLRKLELGPVKLELEPKTERPKPEELVMG